MSLQDNYRKILYYCPSQHRWHSHSRPQWQTAKDIALGISWGHSVTRQQSVASPWWSPWSRTGSWGRAVYAARLYPAVSQRRTAGSCSSLAHIALLPLSLLFSSLRCVYIKIITKQITAGLLLLHASWMHQFLLWYVSKIKSFLDGNRRVTNESIALPVEVVCIHPPHSIFRHLVRTIFGRGAKMLHNRRRGRVTHVTNTTTRRRRRWQAARGPDGRIIIIRANVTRRRPSPCFCCDCFPHLQHTHMQKNINIQSVSNQNQY